MRPSDEVISVSHTFIGTVEPVTMLGGTPRFVDIDEDTYTISPGAAEKWLRENCMVQNNETINRTTGKRVAAIIPVHLYGCAADMEALIELTQQYPMAMLEDACQAHGASYKSARVRGSAGSIGQIGAFSFYPGKNLGALGEGGAAVTNDSALAARMRSLRAHGEVNRYVHETSHGWNNRLATIQAAALAAKLTRLDDWNAHRQKVAQWYTSHLQDVPGIKLPSIPPWSSHVWHLYVVRLPQRDRIRDELADRGIQTGLHYPIPLHKQAAYREPSHAAGSLRVTERIAGEILSLPIHPHLQEEDVAYVCDQLRLLC